MGTGVFEVIHVVRLRPSNLPHESRRAWQDTSVVNPTNVPLEVPDFHAGHKRMEHVPAWISKHGNQVSALCRPRAYDVAFQANTSLDSRFGSFAFRSETTLASSRAPLSMKARVHAALFHLGVATPEV